MSNEDLRQLLTKVHERLSNAGSLDQQARSLLTTVMQDIEKILARKHVGVPPAGPRVESLAVKFETDHPALAEVLRQLADTLGRAGI
jgi:hypothetical protein